MTVKSRLLELLEQHKGETLSGEDIGRELSCTRAAVWKAVNSLRQEGYPIEAGPNKGYMLARESNLISAEGIRLFLEDPQVEIKIFDAISSTNLEARQLAVSGMDTALLLLPWSRQQEEDEEAGSFILLKAVEFISVLFWNRRGHWRAVF